MSVVTKLFGDFIGLIYPNVCAACGNTLFKQEKYICTKCLYFLPKTNFHLEKDNPVCQLFWGKVHIEHAAAFYFFHKGSKYRYLIHSIKYQNLKELGYELGKKYGSELKKSDFYKGIDIVVPLPLHPSKERSRGYNQSEWIARGIAERLNVKVDRNCIKRVIATETQTRKSKFDRWKNVENIFKITDTETLASKHILLVDDVLTTGSTIESCAAELLKAENSKVSVAALAVTD